MVNRGYTSMHKLTHSCSALDYQHHLWDPRCHPECVPLFLTNLGSYVLPEESILWKVEWKVEFQHCYLAAARSTFGESMIQGLCRNDKLGMSTCARAKEQGIDNGRCASLDMGTQELGLRDGVATPKTTQR